MSRFAPLALGALVACGGGDPQPVPQDELPPGFWFDDRFPSGSANMDAAAREAQEALTGIGYASGYEEAGPEHGVVVHDPARTQPGWNLYTSGHGPEALLTDMEGNVVHRWSFDPAAIPGAPPMPDPNMRTWRRAVLHADGSLTAIHEGWGLVRVDRDSRLVGARFGREHHDLVARPEDGSLVVLTQTRRVVPGLGRTTAVLDDEVTVLDRDLRVVQRTSLVEALLASPWASWVREVPADVEDVLHANSLEVVSADGLAALDRRLEAGQWLVCLRDLDAVVVLDPRTQRIPWAFRGGWRRPHDPTAGPNGGLLIFDNQGRDPAGSRVVETSVPDGEVLWSWSGADARLFSPVCGAVSVLPNGNVLVSDSCRGRAHEVTADGAVVWSWVSPHRAGVGDRLVAALFEMVRLPERPGWLPEDPSEGPQEPPERR